MCAKLLADFSYLCKGTGIPTQAQIGILTDTLSVV